MKALQLPDLDMLTFHGFRQVRLLYWAIITLILTACISLQFVSVDVAVNAIGVIRPANERTAIRTMISGVIDSLYYREGSFIPKDSLILTLQNGVTGSRRRALQHDIEEKKIFIHDLEKLTHGTEGHLPAISDLASLLYRRQLLRHIYELNQQQASITKVKKEFATDSLLHAGDVISDKEFFDKGIEAERLKTSQNIARSEQLSIWQQELSALRSELPQLISELEESNQQAGHYEVRAPLAGTIQGLNTRYRGSVLAAGDVVCDVSPESKLIVECIVNSKDIGLIKTGMVVVFQVDAFDRNYFGTVRGKVFSIDNDYTLVDNTPVFKARCELHQESVSLPNGYRGSLKKGLTVHGRFLIAHRKLSQLLFDKIDDWLNPVSA